MEVKEESVVFLKVFNAAKEVLIEEKEPSVTSLKAFREVSILMILFNKVKLASLI
jgi:hypothetical protein